jgi:hypothetical protein
VDDGGGVTEEPNRSALLRAALEAVVAKEAARKSGTRIGAVADNAATKPPPGREALADLSPELRILAQRRARFDNGDRSVCREIFGQQEQTTAKGLDDWDVF